MMPSADERCCTCRENWAPLVFKYRCCKCGQLLCRKCLLSAPSKSVRREQQLFYCDFCIRAANGPEVASRTSDRASVKVSPLILPEDVLFLQSPLSRSSNDRISSAESWQSCSPRSLCSSPHIMKREETESDDDGKEFLTPASVLSNEFSDTDSVSTCTGIEFCSSSSVSPSPLYSPCRLIEQESVSPLLEKICLSDQGSPYHYRKYAVDSVNLLENSDESTCENLEGYHNPERDDATPQFNFESDEIFYPPPAKDEGVDVDTSYTTFTDEHDDIGKLNKLFESGSPSRNLLQRNVEYSEDNKHALRASVHEHLKALVAQLLKEQGIQADALEEPGWLEIVSSLAWEAANYIKPDTRQSGSMDPSEYVKIKCIPAGNSSESTLVKGIVCTKNVKHKRMVSQHRNPRLLLLGGALEFQKVPNELASLQHLLEQEINYIKMALSQIEALQPSVIIVEKSVSLYAQEYLLGKKDVSLVLNVKKSLLERIARCTGAHIVPSIDYAASAVLGHCEVFRTEKVFERFLSSKHPKRNSSKTLMFFEGCPQRLGCTVLIRGSCHDELKKVKQVLQYSIFAAYHLSLETAFLADEGSMPFRLSIRPSVKSMKLIEAHDCVSLVSSFAIPDSRSVENDHKIDKSFSKQDIRSTPEVSLSRSRDSKSGFHCDASSSVSPLPTDRTLSGDKCEDSEFFSKHKISGDYFTADNQQSILVYVSSSCNKTRRACERPQLYRIKFYSCSDKPLGRYLQEYLFNEKYSCRSCKMPTEAHVRCYTHQQGSLTIVVRQLTSMKLPGQHERKIWMWHRCLKCKKDEGEVPPASGRVVMSDAAWGLSFGKFLELNFSSYATSHIASCGHSLQRDCLRFYGCGAMVAVLYYSPADILSVCLPPELLDFTSTIQPEWLRQEVTVVSSQIHDMHVKICDVLNATEEKITSSEYEPLKGIIHSEIINLKDLLEIERHKYHVVLQLLTVGNIESSQIRVDILQLNRLKRAVLLDSFMWDQRLYSLNAFSKELCYTKFDPQLMKFSSKVNLGELGVVIPNKTGMLQKKPEEVTKSLFSSGTENSSFLKQQQELSLEVSEYDINNMIAINLSNESIDGYAGLTCHNSTSEFRDNENKFLKNSMSIWFGPSKKIDFGQSGLEQLVVNQSESNLGVDEYELRMDKSSCRRVNYPLRVYSFDSAFRSPEKRLGGCLPGSLHLAPVKPFDSSANLASMTRDPITSMRRAYSQNSSREAQKLNKFHGHTPVHFSSILEKLTEGTRLLYSQNSSREAQKLNKFHGHTSVHFSSILERLTEGTRLLLPLAGPDNIFIAIHDNEPSSIISYAMSSQEYKDYIMSSFYETEDLNMMGKRSGIGNCYVGATNLRAQKSNSQVNISGRFYGPQLFQRNLLGSKEKHFRIFFHDKYSIPSNMAKFFVTCYFAKQFHALRKQCCPSESDYLHSLSRCKRWNTQGGKSNVYFAKSWDDRFIIKQVTKTELDSFKEFAPQYFKYLNQSMLSGSPTCLAKVFGIYQVVTKYSGGREVKMDVLVMENLFFNKNICSVYDLKGSLRSRYNPDTSGNNTVLLDMNLLETKPVFLERKAKRRLERAIWNDTYFLASIDVMDYSLLVGIDENQKELVVGIIDYMRQYTWDKQLETWVKASGILGGPKNVPPTVISPSQYKKRFRKATSSYFHMIPEE